MNRVGLKRQVRIGLLAWSVALTCAQAEAGEVFRLDARSAGGRGPASMAPSEAASQPQVFKISRAHFLSDRSYLYFDGHSAQPGGRVVQAGADERGSFVFETIVYPLRLNGSRVLFTNTAGHSGLTVAVNNGDLQVTVYLKRRTSVGAAGDFVVHAPGIRAHAWQDIVVQGQASEGAYLVQVFRDGAEIGRGRCMNCGVLEPGRGAVSVGAYPDGQSGFEGYLQNVTLRDAAEGTERFQGLSVAVADGVDDGQSWTGAPPSPSPLSKRLAVPFAADGYRAGPSWAQGGRLLLTLAAPKK
ncbi:MAG TPA: hypothetical protein VL588_08830, partial [Bdellovibrionota bacterium]|nr:hypothetical protein [Bdellovibrionota bacterium]